MLQNGDSHPHECADNQPQRVGFWFSSKKKKKLNCQQLIIILRKYGFEGVEIDLDREIAEQGPFVAIIHKFTDLMICSMNGNQQAERYLKKLKVYISSSPRLLMVDPLDRIKVLLNRYDTYKLIHETRVCSQDKLLHVPSFAQLSSTNVDEIKQQLKRADVRYPFVCKKNISHGSNSHKMCLIFNERGLKDVDPPCVAQTFIDHGALLYKIYVIGERYHMVERPSLRNFAGGQIRRGSTAAQQQETIFFNSHDISSGDSMRSKLTTLEDEEEYGGGKSEGGIDQTIVCRLVKQLSDEIRMTMYGIDIIVCPRTQKHYVIDVNVFPGYDGVDDYLETLVGTIAARRRRRSQDDNHHHAEHQTNGTTNGTHHTDVGI